MRSPEFHQIDVVNDRGEWQKNEGDYFPEWLGEVAVALIDPVPDLDHVLRQIDSGEVKKVASMTHFSWEIDSTNGYLNPLPKRVVISWSGGKDSAWTLHVLRQQPAEYMVSGLLTTINQRFNRIAMHGVRRELLDAQAKAAKLPLFVVPLPSPCTNADYERQMLHSLAGLRSLGIDAIAFGDLYLAEIRQYRITQFAGCGLELLFPIWGLPTRQLAEQMIDSGLKARISCVDPKAVPPEWAGRDFDRSLLADLPPSVDPCAENGEFHTFVYAGPMFANSIAIKTGEIVEREGLVFADLLLEATPIHHGGTEFTEKSETGC